MGVGEVGVCVDYSQPKKKKKINRVKIDPKTIGNEPKL